MSEILYIKIDQNTEVDHIDVRLGDVAKLECTNASVKNRLKTLKLLKIQADKSNRYVFSILKVVELIHEIYPDLEIQNLGEADFIIDYESPEYARDRWSLVKVVLLCITIFIGSAFTNLKDLVINVVTGIGVIIIVKNVMEFASAYQQQDSSSMNSGLKGIVGGLMMAFVGTVLTILGV